VTLLAVRAEGDPVALGAGALAFAGVVAASAAAPYVTGSALLAGFAVVGSPHLLVATAAFGGVAAAVSGFRGGDARLAIGAVLLLLAGVPATPGPRPPSVSARRSRGARRGRVLREGGRAGRTERYRGEYPMRDPDEATDGPTDPRVHPEESPGFGEEPDGLEDIEVSRDVTIGDASPRELRDRHRAAPAGPTPPRRSRTSSTAIPSSAGGPRWRSARADPPRPPSTR